MYVAISLFPSQGVPAFPQLTDYQIPPAIVTRKSLLAPHFPAGEAKTGISHVESRYALCLAARATAGMPALWNRNSSLRSDPAKAQTLPSLRQAQSFRQQLEKAGSARHRGDGTCGHLVGPPAALASATAPRSGPQCVRAQAPRIARHKAARRRHANAGKIPPSGLARQRRCAAAAAARSVKWRGQSGQSIRC